MVHVRQQMRHAISSGAVIQVVKLSARREVDRDPAAREAGAARAAFQIRASWEDHESKVNSIAVSPDGLVVASACANGALKLWAYHPEKHVESCLAMRAPQLAPFSLLTDLGLFLEVMMVEQHSPLRDGHCEEGSHAWGIRGTASNGSSKGIRFSERRISVSVWRARPQQFAATSDAGETSDWNWDGLGDPDIQDSIVSRSGRTILRHWRGSRLSVSVPTTERGIFLRSPT